jgi:hypothetical protein
MLRLLIRLAVQLVVLPFRAFALAVKVVARLLKLILLPRSLVR